VADALPEKILIREVGPREGFQTSSSIIATAKKLEIIRALAQTGLQEIEVTSFVRPDKVPQLADADDLVTSLSTEGLPAALTALYLNQKGFIRAIQYPELLVRGWIATSVSDAFLSKNSNSSRRDDLNSVATWCSLFASHGKMLHGLMLSNSFGCAYEGQVDPKQVLRLIKDYALAATQSGQPLREVCLADTVGMGSPPVVEYLVKGVQDMGIEPSLHLHNTRGLGLINAYEGLRHGVRIFESSVGGVGGCPFTAGASGNIATEELVYLCETLSVETGVAMTKLVEVAHTLANLMGQSLSGTLYKTHKP
jgi:hydroxymethylglutaryl-CoA lyase